MIGEIMMAAGISLLWIYCIHKDLRAVRESDDGDARRRDQALASHRRRSQEIADWNRSPPCE